MIFAREYMLEDAEVASKEHFKNLQRNRHGPYI